MTRLTHPITGKTFKLGRRPSAKFDHLRFGDYLVKPALPKPPPAVSYQRAAGHGLAMILGNDLLADCTAAGAAHLIDIWRGNSGSVAPMVSQADTIAFYSRSAGYVPGQPDTDQGSDLLTVLLHWQGPGFFADGSSKIAGFVAVDATNAVEVMTALWLFEGLYMGAALPDAWLNPMPDGDGFLWGVEGDPVEANGHCTAAVGFNALGVQVDSWGMIGTITWAALAKYYGAAGGELYALLSEEAISRATKKAASGFDFAALAADLAALR